MGNHSRRIPSKLKLAFFLEGSISAHSSPYFPSLHPVQHHYIYSKPVNHSMYLRTRELCFKCKRAYCATAEKWLQGAQREYQSWDENHNIVPVIKQGKQARAHERAEFAPPSYPPPPTGLSNHISVAMCGGRETKISRTSLMHSYCMKYIKKAQTSTRVVGATGRRLSWKKRVYVFSSSHHTERKEK